MWAVTSYYKLYPLTMVLLLLNLLFHDVPQAILVYFYYARFKPPSFDLRIENLIQPCIDILIVLLTTVMQGRNVKRYQVLFKTKIVKIGVWLTSVPVLVVTPILKCSIVLSTIFNQLNTYTSGNNFDPLRTEISNITGSTIVTSKVNNEYPSTVDPFLDDFAPVKEWFSPRQTTCVNTKLSKDGGYWRQIAEPNPFASGCVNYIEWLMLSTVVPLVGGVFSLVFLLRKLWPFLGLDTTLGGIFYLDDRSYKHRPSAFNWRELRRTQLEIKRNTMNRWFSAIDGLSKFTKDDSLTAALKKDNMIGVDKPVYLEYDLPDADFVKNKQKQKDTNPSDDEFSVCSIPSEELTPGLKVDLYNEGIIGRVSQYAEYIIEPPEDSDETESDSESEVELPNRVSQFEANIFEQMTQQAYDGEILSETESYSTDYSTTASISSLELNDIDTKTRDLLSRFRAKLQSEVQRINESGEESDTDSTLTTTTDSSESFSSNLNVATISGSIQRPGDSFVRKRRTTEAIIEEQTASTLPGVAQAARLAARRASRRRSTLIPNSHLSPRRSILKHRPSELFDEITPATPSPPLLPPPIDYNRRRSRRRVSFKFD